MILDKKMLMEQGGFVPAAPIKKEIKWVSATGEQTSFVFVRLKSFQTVMAEIQTAVSGESAAARIAASIVDEKNQPILTIEDIVGNAEHGPLCESLTLALMLAINEANGLDVKPGPKP